MNQEDYAALANVLEEYKFELRLKRKRLGEIFLADVRRIEEAELERKVKRLDKAIGIVEGIEVEG